MSSKVRCTHCGEMFYKKDGKKYYNAWFHNHCLDVLGITPCDICGKSIAKGTAMANHEGIYHQSCFMEKAKFPNEKI